MLDHEKRAFLQERHLIIHVHISSHALNTEGNTCVSTFKKTLCLCLIRYKIWKDISVVFYAIFYAILLYYIKAKKKIDGNLKVLVL